MDEWGIQQTTDYSDAFTFKNLPVLSVITVAALSFQANADSTYTGIHPAQNSTFQLGAGAFISDTDYSARFDSVGDGSTEVDFDKLGVDTDRTSPLGFLRWRFTDRWRFEANYFSTDSSGSNQISRGIEWGDLNFNADANVTTSNDTKVARFAVGYSFLRNDRSELGAGVGLHYLDWKTKPSGNATINGTSVISVSETASVDGFAPNLALFGNYAFNEQWLLTGRFDWISAEIGNFDGSLRQFGAAIMYQPFKNVGFGAGYDYIDVDVDYVHR
ncbi:MAG: porin family protein [Gammaproteobacteria bacterium]|nr:porin family protein [Gammaproteobacteria bacterium]